MNKRMGVVVLLIIAMSLFLAGCMDSAEILHDNDKSSVVFSSDAEKTAEISTGEKDLPIYTLSVGDDAVETAPRSYVADSSSEPSAGTESQISNVLSVSIEAVEEQVSKTGSYCRYVKDEDGIFLVISPDANVRSFRFVTVKVEDTESGLRYSVADELYSIDELTTEKPFLVKMKFVGLLPTYGIVFEDQNNNERFYTINMSGIDAAEGQTYYLNEVKSSKPNGNPQTGVFVDVVPGSYYEDAVEWAVENGITEGTDATHFSPEGICTRAQAVTFLWRAVGSPAPKSSIMPFTDVKSGVYYFDAVLWAVENGIVKGTSVTEFSPNMNCSRAQIVTFLWRSENSPEAGTVNPFTDVKENTYYADAVLWAVKEDVTKGTTGTTFSPEANCTRAQIVTFIWRALAE